MIRILHLSDVHLNTGFANKNSFVRKKIKEALYESIVRAVDFTIAHALEGMIIAGDFFDDDKISFKDEHFILNQLRRILENDQKIFYVTGNHDPMFTARFLDALKQNASFYVFEDDTVKCIDAVSREGEHYKVVGIGHKSKNEQRNLVKSFPSKSTDELWIGIAHASVPSAVDISEKTQYMAVSLAQIEALHYNYFALGHIHIRQLLTPNIGYSGNIQGLNIKETGAKGGLLVTLEPNKTSVEPIDFNVLRWEQCSFELNPDIRTLTDLEQCLIEHVTVKIESLNSAAKQIILRVSLNGKSPLKTQLEETSNCEYLAEIIKDKTGLLDFEIKVSHLANDYNLEALLSEKTVLSQMIKRISEKTYEDALLKNIFSLPIFDGMVAQSEKEKYLHDIKEPLLQEVVERMVVRPDEN